MYIQFCSKIVHQPVDQAGKQQESAQQNAALVEESAAAAASLKEEAQKLWQALLVFKVR